MRDDRGVAGFFEDLPVLVFVLAGTFVIVTSSATVSVELQSDERYKDLETIVNRSLNLVVRSLLEDSSMNGITVRSISESKLALTLSDLLKGFDYSMTITMLHPNLTVVCWVSGPTGEMPADAFSESRLLNCITDDGRIGILMVRLLVW